jgi:hypothetical protein
LDEVLVQMGWKKYYLKSRSSSAIGSLRRDAQGKGLPSHDRSPGLIR